MADQGGPDSATPTRPGESETGTPGGDAGGLHPPPASRPRRPAWSAAIPYLLTAIASVAISLLAQNLLIAGAPAPGAVVATRTGVATAAPSPPPTAAAGASPTAAATAAPIGGDSVLRLTVIDLEEADRQLWSAIYLLRSASQLDDAVTALLVNDLAEADRLLMLARRSLDRAYAFSAEQEKGPIDSFRLQLSQIRDDLGLRPEGADRKLRQLRRLILSLVDEGG